MKAVLLAPELWAHAGGIQRILQLYARALADDSRIATVDIVLLHDTTRPVGAVEALLGAKAGQVFCCAGSRARFLAAAWSAARAADWLICGHLGLAPVAALARRRGARLAVVAHGIEAWQPLRARTRLALRRATHVLAVSHYTANQLAQHQPWLEPQLHVVPNGLATAQLAATPPSGPPKDTLEILCVGRLARADAYKGYEQLLRAFSQVRLDHPAATLRFVGEGDDRARLRALADKLGLAPAVIFAGRLDDAKLAAAFASCYLFALPSTGEGFGLVYIEALAAGSPLVGVAAAATPEIITPDLGALARANDTADLAAKLSEVLARTWSPEALWKAAHTYDFNHFKARLHRALSLE
jgi:phosphatidyl-myo-inositol dimannoside synthase